MNRPGTICFTTIWANHSTRAGRSAFGVRRSAFRRSTLGVRRSALGVRSSAGAIRTSVAGFGVASFWSRGREGVVLQEPVAKCLPTCPGGTRSDRSLARSAWMASLERAVPVGYSVTANQRTANGERRTANGERRAPAPRRSSNGGCQTRSAGITDDQITVQQDVSDRHVRGGYPFQHRSDRSHPNLLAWLVNCRQWHG